MSEQVWYTTGPLTMAEEQRQSLLMKLPTREEFRRQQRAMWTTGALMVRMPEIEPKPEPTEEFQAIEQHTVRRRLGDFGEA